MSINSMVTLTKMSEKMAQLILHEYSILLTFYFCYNPAWGGEGRETRGGERGGKGREGGKGGGMGR